MNNTRYKYFITDVYFYFARGILAIFYDLTVPLGMLLLNNKSLTK